MDSGFDPRPAPDTSPSVDDLWHRLRSQHGIPAGIPSTATNHLFPDLFEEDIA